LKKKKGLPRHSKREGRGGHTRATGNESAHKKKKTRGGDKADNFDGTRGTGPDFFGPKERADDALKKKKINRPKGDDGVHTLRRRVPAI